MPTSDEIMASLAIKQAPKADLSKPLKPLSLHYEFVRAWAEAYPGEMAPPSSGMHLGQLKHLLAWLRSQKIGDAEIVAIVHTAVTRWADFTGYVATHGGPKMNQTRPSPSALLTFRDKAVNFKRAPAAASADGDQYVLKDGLKA